MQIINIKKFVALIALFILAVFALAPAPAVRARSEVQPPPLPPTCERLQVMDGNEVFFKVYALGVQIYRWNGTSWDFVAPSANLYASENYKGQVGIHYGGPTWESNSGSKVVASRLDGCTPDSSAIPWLLLQTVSSEKPGVFGHVTYIQRVNTAGGLRPTTPGSTIGEEVRVPYTAQYYFYRAED